MEQRQLIVPITTASSTLEPVSGYEYWEIENPDTNSNSVFANLNSTATTTATQSTAIRPGTKWFAFVNPFKNPNGVSLIAATGATTVILRKETFRNRLEYGFHFAAASVAAIVANTFFRLTGGDTLVPTGAITTIQARSGANLILENDQANAAFSADAGANGAAFIRADGTGAAILRSSDDTDTFSTSTGGPSVISRNSINLMGFTDTESSFRKMDTAPVVYYDGAGTDERHRFNSTDYRKGMLGTGDVGQVTEENTWTIENGQTINANDLVERSTTTPRVRAAQVGSTLIVGICETGGTGDAGGTVKCVLRDDGMMIGPVVADNAGVTQFQYAIGGATDVNQIASQATLEGSFAKVLETAASGVAVDLDLYGGL